MTAKPGKNFNDKAVPEKAKTHLYSVSVTPKSAPGGDAADDVLEKIRALAEKEGVAEDIKLRSDDGSLKSRGIFFMNAPEKFAAKVKKIKGVKSVDKPGGKKPRGRTPRKKF